MYGKEADVGHSGKPIYLLRTAFSHNMLFHASTVVCILKSALAAWENTQPSKIFRCPSGNRLLAVPLKPAVPLKNILFLRPWQSFRNEMICGIWEKVT